MNVPEDLREMSLEMSERVRYGRERMGQLAADGSSGNDNAVNRRRRSVVRSSGEV